MKRNSKVFGMLTTGILSAALLAGPALAADPEIRVGSYKGNTLEAGERSCLIIGPAGSEYRTVSSNPEAVALERVLTYWVAVAKAEGTAEITVTNADGTAGSLTLTVGTAEAADDFQKETSALAQADTLALLASSLYYRAAWTDEFAAAMTEQDIFTDPSGQTRYAVVKPAVDLDALIKVFVIKDFEIVE